MKLDVRQDAAISFTSTYAISLEGVAFAKASARRVIWPFFHTASLTDTHGVEIAAMRETNLSAKLLGRLLPWCACPFVIRLGGREIGSMRQMLDLRQPVAQGILQGTPYRICGYSGNKHGIFRSGVQAGLVERELMQVNDADVYHADFDADLDPTLCACLIVFMDLVWQTSNSLLSAGCRYESTIQIGGSRLDPNWRPKEKASSQVAEGEKSRGGGG